eukprot:SM000072S21235  [mRNA]  locus=s72:602324:602714:+ [translate_table: standard]
MLAAPDGAGQLGPRKRGARVPAPPGHGRPARAARPAAAPPAAARRAWPTASSTWWLSTPTATATPSRASPASPSFRR